MEQATLIVDAARRLIAERGERFTTQELVKEAGVALQTFYRIFAGKDQLLLAVFDDLIAESCAEYEAAAADLPDPVSRLRFYVTVPIAEPRQRRRRHRSPLRHRRALAAARALPGGDDRTRPSTSPTWSRVSSSSPPRRVSSPRATRSVTRGSSPSW